MAFTLTATEMTGSEVKLTWSDAAASVSIYRTTTQVSSPTATSITDGDLGTALATGKTGTEWTDYTPVSGTTYYYYAYDGTTIVTSSVTPSGPNEFDSDYVVSNMDTINEDSLYVRTQNANGSVSFNELPISAGYLAVIAVKTSAALTESSLATILGSDVQAFQIIAQKNVVAKTGYTPKLTGTLHQKYEAVTQS